LELEGKIIKLSSRESELLILLSKNRNQTIDRKTILMDIWGDDSYYNSRTLDVYIRKLRKYFADDSQIEIITLKGKGYHFIVP
jgi:DNA-binding response OmpR family regulator